MLDLVVVADRQTPEAQQPGICSFDDPSAPIAAETASILIQMLPMRTMGDNQLDAATLQPLPQGATVVAAIGDNAGGLLLRTSRARTAHGYRGERRFREVALGEIGRRKVHSERNTRAVDQYHELRPLTLACVADASAPFFAGANVPSRKASLQSSWARPSNSLRKARQRDNQTSWRSHSPSRRQHVVGLGKCSGKSRHRAPVRSTQRMPSKHPRSGARGRPPRRWRLGFGSSGATFAHCASVSIDCRINSPPSEMMDNHYNTTVRF